MKGSDKVSRTTTKASGTAKRGMPALTPEARESRLISLAENLAEEQLANGTASAQVICHFLKLGTAKTQLEMEKLKHETELMKTKAAAIESNRHSEDMYAKVLRAFKTYSGAGGMEEEDYEEYEEY